MGEDVVEAGLRDLGRRPAPETLLPAVLGRLGLGYWYAPAESPLGTVLVAHGPAGVVAVRWGESPEAFEAWVRERIGHTVRPAERLPERLAAVVEAGLRGRGRDVRCDLGGLSDFHRDVLEATRTIPLGEVRTYGWVAREIGRPGAVRAVGTALGHNPIPLVIPCHRVVQGDWRLGNYSGDGGPDSKRRVLAAEGVDPGELEALARSRVRFHGSDTTRIFCVPTCRHARRATEAHRVTFGSEAAARAAGYRPCKVCRPAAAA
ncbi:MAG TPA: methylated-DNA--[protein]-cysteine S-methyltransferase [Candidatus Dormibacteraeota bacterium]|nr:methylated-DNA--[protein]-cysteine S-methyltransferase [Candidatus Dormibacteraeota bacterium]